MARIARWLALIVRRGAGDRGRRADSPAAIPLVGWRDIAIRAWRGAKADNLNVLAAGIAFYAFLALLPLVASTAMIYGLLREPANVVEDVRTLVAIFPAAAQEVVAGRVVEIVMDRRGAPVLGLALLFTLYAGARGARSVTAALNTIYDEGDVQRLAGRWGVPLLAALGGAVLALLALIAVALFGYVGTLTGDGPRLGWLAASLAFWLPATLIVGGGSAALYRYAPKRRRARWVWVIPGALATTLLWLGVTIAFGFVLARFGRHDASYGSLASVVVLLLWIYFSTLILLFGAKLNAEIELQTARDTTVGAPRPAGRRRAASADRVGEIPKIEAGRPASE